MSDPLPELFEIVWKRIDGTTLARVVLAAERDEDFFEVTTNVDDVLGESSDGAADRLVIAASAAMRAFREAWHDNGRAL